MESITLNCLTPGAFYLNDNTIGQRDLETLQGALETWKGIVEDILVDPDTARDFHEEVHLILSDVFELHGALTHIAGAGSDVSVHVTCEVSPLDLARISRRIGERSCQVEGGLAAIASLIVDLLDDDEEPEAEPTPAGEPEVEWPAPMGAREANTLARLEAVENGLRLIDQKGHNMGDRIRKMENDLFGEDNGLATAIKAGVGRCRERLDALEGAIAARRDNGPTDWQVPEHGESAAQGEVT